MSIVVAASQNGKMYLAADTHFTGLSKEHTRPQYQKIFKAENIDLYVGWAGTVTFGQYLMTLDLAGLFVMTEDSTLYDWTLYDLIPHLRKDLEELYMARYTEEEGFTSDGQILLAYENQIVVIESDFSVMIVTPSVGTAIGSGYQYALGSLFSSSLIVNRARSAVEAAIKYSPDCGGDVYVLEYYLDGTWSKNDE